MKYNFANVTTTRATIGDMREQIDIETVNMKPTNDFTGEYEDEIVILARVWVAVIVNAHGVDRMLGINVDKQEVPTHEFYCRYWQEEFLEARYISWKGNRYRIIRPQDIRGQVDQFQIRFLCVLKGDTAKKANTYG